MANPNSLSRSEIDVALKHFEDVLLGSRSEIRALYYDHATAKPEIGQQASVYIGDYLGYMRDVERVDLGDPRALRQLLEDCASALVGNWLDKYAPSNIYAELTQQERQTASASTAQISEFYNATSRGRSGFGGQSRGGFGSGLGHSGSSQQTSASGFFGGQSSRLPVSRQEGRRPITGGETEHEEPESRMGFFSVREEVSTARDQRQPPQAPPAQKVAEKPQEKVMNEAIYMQELLHATNGILRNMTRGDQQSRLLSEKDTETYCERASVIDALRKGAATGGPVLEMDTNAPVKPIFLGALVDVTPELPAIMVLKAGVAQQETLQDVDLSETPIYAIRYSYNDWGVPKAGMDPSLIDYQGKTHEANVAYLARLERFVPLHDFRALVKSITDHVNDWLFIHAPDVSLDSYAIDGDALGEYLKMRGLLEAKQAWSLHAEQIATFLNPTLLGPEESESYYYLHRCEALLKLPMRSVQFPVGATLDVTQPMLVTPNSTPALAKLLVNWFSQSNAADTHTIVFEDGRTIQVINRKGRFYLKA